MLVPVSRQNLPQLYQWVTNIETTMLWINRRDILTYEQYVEEMEWKIKHQVFTQLVITRRNDPAAVGTIYAYDTNFTDGYTFITVYLMPTCTRIGFGTEASQLFIDYLFAYLPLRKIYTEVFAYNQRSLAVMRAAGLQEEGCFRAHRWFNGMYHDLYRFALYSKDWPEIRVRYLEYAQQHAIEHSVKKEDQPLHNC